MRKLYLLVMISLLSCTSLSAFFWPEALDYTIELGGGFRKDNFKFETVANPFRESESYSSSYSDYGYYGPYDDYYYFSDYGSSYGPSEEYVYGNPIEGYPGCHDCGCDNLDTIAKSVLDWKNLNITFVEGRVRYVSCDNFYLRGGGDYGWICSGLNEDTYNERFPFDPEFPQQDTYTVLAKTTSKTKGYVYDVDVAFGYQFLFCDDNFAWSPLIGYAWKGQHLHNHDLRLHETLACGGSPYYFSSGSGSSNNSVSGLHSKYNARWNGPFIGFDSEYFFKCNWSFMFNYEYHWGHFHAKAFWNLNPDFPHGFTHRTKSSYGHVVDGAIKCTLCERVTMSLHCGFQFFRANHGKDVSILEKDSFGNVSERFTRSISLRKAQWYTTSVSLDLGLVF